MQRIHSLKCHQKVDIKKVEVIPVKQTLASILKITFLIGFGFYVGFHVGHKVALQDLAAIVDKLVPMEAK